MKEDESRIDPPPTSEPAESSSDPESSRLDPEGRRALIGRIAATASRRELRAIQAEIIAAYVQMAMRRSAVTENDERVREAARARLAIIGKRKSVPSVAVSDASEAAEGGEPDASALLEKSERAGD